MTPEQRATALAERVNTIGSISCDDLVAIQQEAIAEERDRACERIAALEAALRDVLDEVGPCDLSEKARGFCCHDEGYRRLPCPFAAARKVCESGEKK